MLVIYRCAWRSSSPADRAVVAQIASLTTIDPNFILKPDGFFSVKKIKEKDRISYQDVMDFVRIMESWVEVRCAALTCEQQRKKVPSLCSMSSRFGC